MITSRILSFGTRKVGGPGVEKDKYDSLLPKRSASRLPHPSEEQSFNRILFDPAGPIRLLASKDAGKALAVGQAGLHGVYSRRIQA